MALKIPVERCNNITYYISDKYTIGEYTHQDGTKRTFLIDTSSFPEVKKYTWGWNKSYFVYRDENKKQKYLHQLIMEINGIKIIDDKNFVIDHISRNRYDNTIDNLRIVSLSENSRNRSWISKTNNTGLVNIYFEPEEIRSSKNSPAYRVTISDKGMNTVVARCETLLQAVLCRIDAYKSVLNRELDFPDFILGEEKDLMNLRDVLDK